jgi:hypothetical protein
MPFAIPDRQPLQQRLSEIQGSLRPGGG